MKNNANYVGLKSLTEDKRKVTLYVLPDVVTEESHFHFILAGYVDGIFTIVDKNLDDLGDPSMYRPGMRLEINRVLDHYRVEYMGVISPILWKYGGQYTAKSSYSIFRGKTTKVYYGQTVLVLAAPGGGKTTCCRKLLDSFESNGAIVFRLLFGERRVDSLGPGTIDSDSSAPIGYQVNVLYQVILDSLIDAYNGENVIIGIDSLTRIVEVMTSMYSGTHLVAGGISSPVKLMVSNLIRMAGQYRHGSITIVGTCLWARSNSTWKNIASEMKAAANVELQPDVDAGRGDFNREKVTKEYPTVKIFGKEFPY